MNEATTTATAAEDSVRSSETLPSASSSDDKLVTKRARRRWLQYSLRGLLLLMLIAAVGTWWLGQRMNQAWRQEQAIAALSEVAPISISYAYQLQPDGSIDRNAEAPQDYAWWREVLGDAFFDKPVSICIPTIILTEEHAHWLADLPKLREVQIVGPTQNMDRDAFRVLSQLPELRQLRCARQGITAEDIAGLGPLPHLKKLELGYGLYSQSAMQGLAENCPGLEEFVIGGGSFEEGALQPLGELRSLRRLQMTYCSFADQDFSSVRSTSLVTLDLSHSDVADEGLAHIGNVKTLEELTLESTPITDAGMRGLESMPRLRILDLTLTNVTDAGFGSLAQLQSLRELSLCCCTRVMGKQIAELTTLEDLEELDLNGTGIARETYASINKLGIGKIKLRELGSPGKSGLQEWVELMQQRKELSKKNESQPKN